MYTPYKIFISTHFYNTSNIYNIYNFDIAYIYLYICIYDRVLIEYSSIYSSIYSNTYNLTD